MRAVKANIVTGVSRFTDIIFQPFLYFLGRIKNVLVVILYFLPRVMIISELIQFAENASFHKVKHLPKTAKKQVRKIAVKYLIESNFKIQVKLDS